MVNINIADKALQNVRKLNLRKSERCCIKRHPQKLTPQKTEHSKCFKKNHLYQSNDQFSKYYLYILHFLIGIFTQQNQMKVLYENFLNDLILIDSRACSKPNAFDIISSVQEQEWFNFHTKLIHSITTANNWNANLLLFPFQFARASCAQQACCQISTKTKRIEWCIALNGLCDK